MGVDISSSISIEVYICASIKYRCSYKMTCGAALAGAFPARNVYSVQALSLTTGFPWVGKSLKKSGIRF